ncbi:hypothetical protein [Nonomuraea sp. SYSU D8015]|uniref:hypothetical protein n=1 Tax=Nonomuraea sp. SYSU D8015 TaxID=2593644 RepID=UPI001660DAA6|nr:hypothetical protein [Nonomuraea sp. SYSU D8015]
MNTLVRAAMLRADAEKETDQQVIDADMAVADLLETIDAGCLPPDVVAAAERAAEALIALYPEEEPC